MYNSPDQEMNVQKDFLAARTNFTADLQLSELELSSKEENLPAENFKQHEVPKGLSETIGLMYVAASLVGCGILQLSDSLAKTGWYGMFLFVFCGVYALYSNLCMGRCWLIMEERWEQYRAPQRRPFASIAYKVGGRWLQYFVSFCLNVCCIGTGTVLVAMMAQQIVVVLPRGGIPVCYWIIILPILFTPTLFPGTPRELKWVGVISVVTVIMSIALLIIAIFINKRELKEEAYGNPTLSSLFRAYGAIVWTFAGGISIPTVHIVSKNKKTFPKTIVSGYLFVYCLYFPISMVGFASYGDKIKTSVMHSVVINLRYTSTRYIIGAAHVLFIIHLWASYVICLNPALQDLEEYLKIPFRFGIHRCMVRSSVSVLSTILSISFTNTNLVMEVIGATTMTILIFILPPLFYIRLVSNSDPSWPQRYISRLEKMCLISMSLIGFIGGAFSTYYSIGYQLSEEEKIGCFFNMSQTIEYQL